MYRTFEGWKVSVPKQGSHAWGLEHGLLRGMCACMLICFRPLFGSLCLGIAYDGPGKWGRGGGNEDSGSKEQTFLRLLLFHQSS
jgi:hypothetical protein